MSHTVDPRLEQDLRQSRARGPVRIVVGPNLLQEDIAPVTHLHRSATDLGALTATIANSRERSGDVAPSALKLLAKGFGKVWGDAATVAPGHTLTRRPVQWPIFPMLLAPALEHGRRTTSDVGGGAARPARNSPAPEARRTVRVIDDSPAARTHMRRASSPFRSS